MDNELLLFDRLEVIKNTINQFGEENFYIAYSGGKDSTLVSHLIDEALPNNQIPRVYINTGIEYVDMVKFVRSQAEKDNRIVICNANVNIHEMLEKYGYPFKSKVHSHMVRVYQHSGKTKYVESYAKGIKYNGSKSRFACPNALKYQFEKEMPFKISEICCDKLKKQTIHKWEKANNKHSQIVGVRMSEGGTRIFKTGCVVFDDDGHTSVKRFKPINPCDDEWCKWYIETRNIELCKLYYPPYNFERTGCKGCPFALHLQEELDKMEKLLPNERKQCELLWKPVYDEYRRIGYRLENVEQTKLF